MMEQTDNLIKLSNGQVLSKETIDGDIATINFGPTHPATHGIFQNILTVDGEKILTSVQTVGYIHRAFEKLAERRPYNQITPITVSTAGVSTSSTVNVAPGLLFRAFSDGSTWYIYGLARN